MSKLIDSYINGDHRPKQDFVIVSDKLPTSKEQLTAFVETVKDNILEGRISYEQALIGRKLFLEAFDQIFNDADVKEHLQTEHAKHPGKNKWNGATIEHKSRKVYHYEKSGCKFYEQLKREIKEREEFLKSIKEPVTIVDDKTGECNTIHPTPFTVTEYFTVSLNK